MTIPTPILKRLTVLALLTLLPGVGCAAESRNAPPDPTSPQAVAPAEAGTGVAESRPAGLRFPDPLRTPIEATILSFPTDYYHPEEAADFLRALRARAPAQDLVVLADPAMEKGLAATAESLGVTVIGTGDHVLSPWPRDPFSVAVDGDGGLVLVDRPYRQPSREGDAEMAPVLVAGLPEGLARAWGGVRRWEAPIPFHNGHMLPTDKALWVSLHSLEPRILQILQTDRVPVESFATADGIDRYLRAAERATDELGSLFGRSIRLVHPLPRSQPLPVQRDLMARIGGGAGFDLDSVVTLLADRPGGVDGPRALVGSLNAGLNLIRGLDAEGWRSLTATYDLGGSGDELARALLAYGTTRRAQGLADFLDLVSTHLEASGLRVHRLPLVLIPLDVVPGTEGLLHPDFVLGWNNVVIERREDGVRALGFASGLPSGDRLARKAYEAVGVRLELLPPLASSILNNGGFRCASNQVRRPRERP